MYCQKYHVSLVPEKTKLQVHIPKHLDVLTNYIRAATPLHIDSMNIPFVDEAEHVGIVRSVYGNLPHLLNRVSSFRKAMASVLQAGIARRHRGNPAAALRVLQTYGTPVLLSGTASLVLSKPETNAVDRTVQNYLLNIQKLRQKTPRSVICFLGGSLPGTALLHLRQLSIFGMITRLPESILNNIGKSILTCEKPSCRSWFFQIRQLCQDYCLPCPLYFLENPPSKASFKYLVKRQVFKYWEHFLCAEAASLPSLEFFHPQNMSLSSPHPIWTTAGSNSFEVSKAVIQARMLSGRYPTDSLSQHWTDKDGSCSLITCKGNNVPGTLDHLLLTCPSLAQCRKNLVKLCNTTCEEDDITAYVLRAVREAGDSKTMMQFLLDCTALPCVSMLTQTYGTQILTPLFYLSRTWCYNIHRSRYRLLGLWAFL